jgi:hypothetical protein
LRGREQHEQHFLLLPPSFISAASKTLRQSAVSDLSVYKVPGTTTGRKHLHREQTLRRSRAGKNCRSSSNVTDDRRIYAEYRFWNVDGRWCWDRRTSRFGRTALQRGASARAESRWRSLSQEPTFISRWARRTSSATSPRGFPCAAKRATITGMSWHHIPKDDARKQAHLAPCECGRIIAQTGVTWCC